MNRSRLVALTAAWQVGAQLVNIAQQFVTVPIFLSAWGGDTYGTWITLSATVSYLSLADAGLATYLINRLTELYVKGDRASYREHIASGSMMYFLTCGVGLVLLGVASVLWAGSHLLVVLLLGFQAIATILFVYSVGLYRTILRADLQSFLWFLSRVVLFVVTIALLIARARPVMLAFGQFATISAFALFCFIDAGRREPLALVTLQGARRDLAWQLLVPSLTFLVIMLSFTFTVGGLTIAVATMLTASAVVVFNSSRTVANPIRNAIVLVGQALQPEMTRANAEGAWDRLSLIHRLGVKTAACIAIPTASVLLFVGPYLYVRWTHGQVGVNVPLLRLLLIDQIVTTPGYVSGMLLHATNRYRVLSFFHLVHGALTVGAVALAVHGFGLTSAGVVMLAFDVVLYGYGIPSLVQQQLTEPLRNYLRRLTLPVLFAAGVGIAVTGGISALVHPESVLRVVVVLAIAPVIALATSVVILFDATERAWVTEKLRSALRRR